MNAVTAERPANPVVVFRSELDGMGEQFKAALPAHIPVERFARVVMTAVQQNPELLECNRRSVWNAAMRAAQDGLLPDGREGAMVVRRSRDGGKEANWQPMVAGIRKKARNSGEIATWDVHVVREGDHFQFQLGDSPQVNHTYDLRTERGGILGAYSVCTLKDGQKSYEVMTIGEIHAIRDRSDAWRAFKAGKIKSTPWSTDEGEMCRKTVARRHSKVLPMSTDLDDLIRRDEDLYDFEGAKEEAKATRPRGLAGKLDALALPEPGKPALQTEDAETVDPKTGEVTETGGSSPAGAAPTGTAAQPSPSSQAAGQPSQTGAGKPEKDASTGAPAGAVATAGGNGAAAEAVPATAPAFTAEEIAAAEARGDEAFGKGAARKAVPAEWREARFVTLVEAWRRGFDRARKAAEEGEGS